MLFSKVTVLLRSGIQNTDRGDARFAKEEHMSLKQRYKCICEEFTHKLLSCSCQPAVQLGITEQSFPHRFTHCFQVR